MAVATATKIDRTANPDPKHNIEAVRQGLSTTASPSSDMAPLWKVMNSVVTKEPVTRCQPHVWHYDDVKSLVMESGGLITAEEAQSPRPGPGKPGACTANRRPPTRCSPASR